MGVGAGGGIVAGVSAGMHRQFVNRQFVNRQFIGRQFVGRQFIGRQFIGRQFVDIKQRGQHPNKLTQRLTEYCAIEALQS